MAKDLEPRGGLTGEAGEWGTLCHRMLRSLGDPALSWEKAPPYVYTVSTEVTGCDHSCHTEQVFSKADISWP